MFIFINPIHTLWLNFRDQFYIIRISTFRSSRRSVSFGCSIKNFVRISHLPSCVLNVHPSHPLCFITYFVKSTNYEVTHLLKFLLMQTSHNKKLLERFWVLKYRHILFNVQLLGTACHILTWPASLFNCHGSFFWTRPEGSRQSALLSFSLSQRHKICIMGIDCNKSAEGVYKLSLLTTLSVPKHLWVVKRARFYLESWLNSFKSNWNLTKSVICSVWTECRQCIR